MPFCFSDQFPSMHHKLVWFENKFRRTNHTSFGTLETWPEWMKGIFDFILEVFTTSYLFVFSSSPFHWSRQACNANDLETMKCQVYSILGGGVSNINFLFQRKLKGHFNQSLLILSFTLHQWMTLVRFGMYLLNGYFRILEENECWSE